MLKKANINWSAKQLVKSIEKETIKFDLSVQRSLVWDNDRKSLLIHSMADGYPVPPFYSAKEDGIYQFLDGKQRSNAISEFMNDGFKLSNVPEIITEDGEEIDINGFLFSELSEELQDAIKDYSLTVYYFDGITEEEIASLFFRLNNGKPLSSIELTRVKAKSIEAIKRIGAHDMFTSALTSKSIEKYTNEDIVIKAWATLNTESPSFETKVIRPLMTDMEITDENEKDLCDVFTRIKEAYEVVLTLSSDEKLNNKIAKRMFTRTHLLSIVPVTLQSIKSEISVNDFAKWFSTFFCGTRSASIDDTYNDNAGAGSARTLAVQARLDAVQKSYNAYVNSLK